jgi:L-ribulose-5-phosphate 3-epimerase
MNTQMKRRDFLAMTAAAATATVIGSRCEAAPAKGKMKKALIGNPNEKTLTTWKAAGIEGMETGAWNVSPEKAAEGRLLAEKHGIKIHSVIRAWVNFNSRDPDAVKKDIASVETALRAAEGYGADAILLVPCKTGGIKMPEPWEFDIKFDPKNGHLKQVVSGDNGPYKDYIAAHDHATDSTRKALEQLIPTAEKTGVVIALENVWNNLWVKPDLFTNFVSSFDSPSIKAYFDIGNHVKYAAPQEWIRSLGKLIVKCHVKDFKLKADGHGGNFCNIREGSVDWPAVVKELQAVGYDGWMTLEGSGKLSLEEQNKRLDLIVAGK